jgi:hypothetical protein
MFITLANTSEHINLSLDTVKYSIYPRGIHGAFQLRNSTHPGYTKALFKSSLDRGKPVSLLKCSTIARGRLVAMILLKNLIEGPWCC